MSLNDKDILHVAKLSALALAPSELEQRKTELNSIIDYIQQLNELNTKGVPPTSHVHGVINFFRDDIVQDSLPVSELEAMAPDFVSSAFRVPKIIA